MSSLNKVMLIGNLTRDPESRVLLKGSSVASFALAINSSYKDGAGNLKEEVTFIDCEAWGKQGETIQKYCTKGKSLFVEGRLQVDQWEDKTSGQKRSRMKVVVGNFQFLGSKPADGEGGQRSAPPARQGSRTPSNAPVGDDHGADVDVPF